MMFYESQRNLQYFKVAGRWLPDHQAAEKTLSAFKIARIEMIVNFDLLKHTGTMPFFASSIFCLAKNREG